MNCQLSGQTKPGSDIVVNQRLHSLFVHQPRFHSPVRVFTSIRKRLQQFVNEGDLFRSNLELTRYSQDLLHNLILSQYVRKYKYGQQFLPAHEYMDEESLPQTVEQN